MAGGNLYTPQEDSIILSMRKDGATYEQIGKAIQRNHRSVQNRYVILQTKHRDFESKFEKSKSEHAAIKAHIENTKQAILNIIRPKYATPRRILYHPKNTQFHESGFAPWSDIHTGDKASELKRIIRATEKTIEYFAYHMKAYNIKKLYIPFLGDFATGTLIYPSQVWDVNMALLEQIDKLSDTLADCLNELSKYFEIQVDGIPGNHGRLGRFGEGHRDDNADNIVYLMVKKMLRENKRVNINIAQDYKCIREIEGHNFMFFHGNQIRASLGIPWYGLIRKAQAWYMTNSQKEGLTHIRYFVCGHWHKFGIIPLNNCRILVNGTCQSDTDFSDEVLGSLPDLSWHLATVGKENGITNYRELYLDR
jgi:hypothetical protein